MKYVITVFSLLAVLLTGILWGTRETWLPSISAFAESPNVFYYYGMHGCITLAYSVEFLRRRRLLALLTAFWPTFVVYFDMYSAPFEHNFTTFMLFVSAMVYNIVHAHGKTVLYNIVNGLSGGIIFLIGWKVFEVHLFFAEVIAICCIVIGLMWLLWESKKEEMR